MSAEVKEKLIAYRSVLADLEKAGGADIWLDRAVSIALDQPWDWSVDWRGWGYDEAGKSIEQEKAFPYTSSLDAAIALVERVLPGWAREVSLWGNLARASLWECDREGWHGSKSNKVTATSKTEPLALLTALFRALIAQMEKADG
ncbi:MULTISPECIES: hypothetical protein [unclassified Chelatococcus]|uniref:hypothetical protein n=1 Tax=unclassified Chelatococcus TaxID=2638111 RepID=UPI001BCB377B|nr:MULTISPECIES: hypothetical protein [unclassified Chelatococcus]MBS7697836.1 hypothetical protein [Chelatococcus sp. YT9]MBS7698568.1 hypothetical protein [Chelatococcus sp. YT9]MBX3559809.1 hypothetical protein [Chelatococcus sp.]